MANATRAPAEATTRSSTETEIDVEPAPGEAAGDIDIAAVAALMADPSRAAVLIELTDGRALPPSELAEVAGVSRSTISEHLAKLGRAGFLTVEQGGRNRYFRLAGPEIATAVESLAALAPRFPVRSLKQSRCAAALGAARTCYGHLAGRLGVVIARRLFELDWLERTPRAREVRVTPQGEVGLGRELSLSFRASPLSGRETRGCAR
jgi:DNA-binding transcriptional ArsR family regulator